MSEKTGSAFTPKRETFPERKGQTPTVNMDVIDAAETIDIRMVEGFKATLRILEVRTTQGAGFRAAVDMEGGGGRNGEYRKTKAEALKEGNNLLDQVTGEQRKKIAGIREARRQAMLDAMDDDQ